LKDAVDRRAVPNLSLKPSNVLAVVVRTDEKEI
jgi:hypothetical protein